MGGHPGLELDGAAQVLERVVALAVTSSPASATEPATPNASIPSIGCNGRKRSPAKILARLDVVDAQGGVARVHDRARPG